MQLPPHPAHDRRVPDADGGTRVTPEAPAVLTLTCGMRIPITDPIRSAAYACAAGKPGILRASLVCVRPAHDETGEHLALARSIPSDHGGGAVWARWHTSSPAPSFTHGSHCPLATDDETLCALFEGHPGLCAFSRAEIFQHLPGRREEILAHLQVLGQPEASTAMTLQGAAAWAGLLLWDEVRARRVWAQLPAWDQAAVHWLLVRANSPDAHDPQSSGLLADAAYVADLCGISTGIQRPGVTGPQAAALLTELRALPQPWQITVLAGQRTAPQQQEAGFLQAPPAPTPRRPLREAIQDAADRAARGESAPEPTPQQTWSTPQEARDDADRLFKQLGALPDGWQVEVIRKTTGDMDILAALLPATTGINVLTNHGVYLAWTAGHPLPRAAARR